MSQLHEALALAARLHEQGAVTYREYLELHKALTAAHAPAEHAVTLEFSEGVAAKMTCRAAAGADCRQPYYEDEPEPGDGGCYATATFNAALTWDELVVPGSATVPVYPLRAADAEDCWEFSLSPEDGA